MQPSSRKGRLSTAPGAGTAGQENVSSSPSISGDLRLLHTVDCGDQLLCCQFNNDGTRIAVGLRTGTIKVYSVSDGSLVHVLTDHDISSAGLPVTSMRFMPRGPAHNGDVLLSTYSGGMVKLWHVSSRTCVRTMKENRQTMIASFNPSGSKFITAGSGPGICMYDAQTWDNVGTFQASDNPNLMDGHWSRVYALTFFPENDDRFVSGGWDNTVQFWNVQLPHSQRRLSGPHICGDAVSIDKTGTQVLTGSWRRNNSLQIWDAETGNKLLDIPEDFRGPSQIYSCHFLGTDHIIAGGSRNNICRLIDRRILMSTGVLNDLPGVSTVPTPAAAESSASPPATSFISHRLQFDHEPSIQLAPIRILATAKRETTNLIQSCASPKDSHHALLLKVTAGLPAVLPECSASLQTLSDHGLPLEIPARLSVANPNMLC